MEARDNGQWFKQQLVELGLTQASFGRLMVAHGDDRTIETIDRAIRRMANGTARVSGEMRVVLELLRRTKS